MHADPGELAHAIARFDCVLAHRLHACIVAYSYRIPAVGFAWDRKLDSFFAQCDRSRFMTDPRETSPESLVALALVSLGAAAADSPAPVRLDADKMAGLDLTAIPPDAYSDILVAGELNMRVASLFEGKELAVSIFESTPATTAGPNESSKLIVPALEPANFA